MRRVLGYWDIGYWENGKLRVCLHFSEIGYISIYTFVDIVCLNFQLVTYILGKIRFIKTDIEIVDQFS